MSSNSPGRFVARPATGAEEIARAQRLRWRAFFAARGLGGDEGQDSDGFDAACQHIIVEEVGTGDIVGCCRLRAFGSGPEIEIGYSAQFYDLHKLAGYPGPMTEMGRFCLAPGRHDAAILRTAWGAIARFVDATGTEILFGCTSLPGADAALHKAALAALGGRHLAPRRWRPEAKAAETIAFGSLPLISGSARGLRILPPLLRAYLGLGGWVSDHAVVDRALDTLHVFTALEIGNLPVARARSIRRAA